MVFTSEGVTEWAFSSTLEAGVAAGPSLSLQPVRAAVRAKLPNSKREGVLRCAI
jgi:hypothetical protein